MFKVLISMSGMCKLHSLTQYFSDPPLSVTIYSCQKMLQNETIMSKLCWKLEITCNILYWQQHILCPLRLTKIESPFCLITLTQIIGKKYPNRIVLSHVIPQGLPFYLQNAKSSVYVTGNILRNNSDSQHCGITFKGTDTILNTGTIFNQYSKRIVN